jgi:hypothetical protein
MCIRSASVTPPVAESDHQQGEGNEVQAKRLTLNHLRPRVRVDDLVAQGAEGEVWALGDVGELVCWWLGDGSAYFQKFQEEVSVEAPKRRRFRRTVDGPKAAEDAEEGGFAGSVACDREEQRQAKAPLRSRGRALTSDDEQMVARLDVEAESLDQDVPVGRDDGNVVEDDLVIRVDEPASALQNCEMAKVSSAMREGEDRDGPLAFSSVPAELTSFFWYLPVLISSMVSSSSETR